MKSIYMITAMATLITCLPATAQESAAKPRIFSVAVLPFAETDDTKSLGASAAESLAAQLGNSGNLVLVERSQLDAILSEQGMGMTGAIDPKSAAKVGGLLGAQILVTGRVFKAGRSTLCVAKAVGVATGRSLPVQAEVKNDDWIAASATLAKALEEAVAKHSTDLVAKTETTEQRMERLKAMVAGKIMPKVIVRIPEEHLTRHVPDPAVQTEIEVTLQQLGATLVTTEADADIVVAGEAFSERATQIGALVSCRARCELSLMKKSAPGQKQVNRMTTGAVDIAENTAAKLALQNAGSNLAEWVVTEIIK